MTPLFISESHVIPHPCLCGRNVRVSSIHRMKRLREYSISSNKDPLRGGADGHARAAGPKYSKWGHGHSTCSRNSGGSPSQRNREYRWLQCASCLVCVVLPEVVVTKEMTNDLPVFFDANRLVVVVTTTAVVVHLLCTGIIITLVLVVVVVPVLLALLLLLLLLIVPAIIAVGLGLGGDIGAVCDGL